MKRLEYQVSFATPAFLGNAEQLAQWRTPPFKALIRQWWRVVQAPQVNFEVERLRDEEGRLFGVAADGGESSRSLVRFRLSEWSPGTLKEWDGDDRIPHPEVTNHAGQVMQIGAQLYLGYGPLTYRQGNTALNNAPPRTAIAPNLTRVLTVIVPDAHAAGVGQAVQLTAWFGTLGSRARNGWGALQLTAQEGTPAIPALTADGLTGVTRPLGQCLGLDWPHAVGVDAGRPLVWETTPKASSGEVMRDLARLKIAFRTQPTAMSLADVVRGRFAPRHLLAYPVTHHNVFGDGWGNQGRLANQIRFKVARQGTQFVGVIAHLPCRLPAEMVAALPPNQRGTLDALALNAWREVHQVIDQNAHRMQ